MVFLLRKALLVGFMFAVSLTAVAQEKLATYELKYTASLYGYSLDITSSLKSLGKSRYLLENYIDSMAGELKETSVITWDDAKHWVVPSDYRKSWSVIGKSSNEAVLFDWKRQLAASTSKNTSMSLAGLGNPQSSLSYALQMRQDFIDGKKSVAYNMVDGESNTVYRFNIVGEEVVDTALGKVKAVKVKRIQTGARETYVWLAKDYQYVLLKFEQRRNGLVYTFAIEKAAINGKTIQRF